MYRVLWSGSPNSTLATSSGVSMVPKCLPSGETIHTPPAADSQTFPFMSTFRPSVIPGVGSPLRSEEHTSELQSQSNLVCRLLLEKKKKKRNLFQISIRKMKKTYA